MKSILLFYASVLLIACQDAEPADATKDASDIRNDTLQESKSICFEKLEGANKKDSTIIRLQIDGNQVSGIYWWLPHQKDSRVGDIRGTIHENEISGKWIYMQEGMIDTI